MLQSINKGQVKKFKTVAKGGLFLAAVLCFLFCFFIPVFAQPIDVGLNYAEQTGLPTTDIREIIANVIRVALGLLGIIAVVIIMYGGWLWMTAGGNEEQIGRAKKTLINGAVGLAIILSAYSIVLFVMNLLGIGGGNNERDYNYTPPPGIMNMAGTGAWGKIILDHYPVPNQVDVPRNTKIAITFAKPVDATSFTTEVTDETLGAEAGAMVFQLNNEVIKINALIPSSTVQGGYDKQLISGAKVYLFPIETTTASGVTEEIFTIVIEPNDLLGDIKDNVNYEVWVDGLLKGKDGKSIFLGAKSPYYHWYFTCSTELDNTPPHVVSVFPSKGATETKDSILEITFSEPVFPNAQVSFTSTSGYYEDRVNNYPIVFIKNASSTVPLGTFKITNQYRTLEFNSTIECGTDACGNPKYCLPVCDKAGADCKTDEYQVVFKTAPTSTNPEKPPFTADLSSGNGIMDMAGNALNGNNNDIYERNSLAPFVTGFNGPDNYGWSFILEDELDSTTPYIRGLSIGPETERVSAGQAMNIFWSKLMKKSSLYSININEFPSPEDRCNTLLAEGKITNIKNCSTDTLGKSPSSTDYFVIEFNTTTFTEILHNPFLDGFDQYYLPEITSAVSDIKGNCYYPGKGPKTKGMNVACTGGDCCDGPYCCNGDAKNNPTGGTYSNSCYNILTSTY